MKKWMLLVAVAVFCLSGGRAQADGSNPTLATYDITGSFKITGNNACSGTCTQTVSYSFLLDYNTTTHSPVGTTYDPVQQGGFNLSSSGPLSLTTGSCCSNFASDSGVIEITNGVTGTTTGYDEIDLQLIFGNNPNAAPTLGYAEIFACASSKCVQDFNPYGIATYGVAIPITSTQFSATAVPEPPVWLLLLSGLLGLALLRVGYVLWSTRRQVCPA
jgi:hypothetical protein